MNRREEIPIADQIAIERLKQLKMQTAKASRDFGIIDDAERSEPMFAWMALVDRDLIAWLTLGFSVLGIVVQFVIFFITLGYHR